MRGPVRVDTVLSIPAMAMIERLQLDRPVTLLAGENGTGKSTILEAIAEAMGFAEQGGELERLGELPAVPRAVLDGALAPALTDTRPRAGYYLRAESFFNIAAFVDSDARFSPDRSIYGNVPLHEQSHGESFLALAANRFGADGLYLLDEPEAALSVTGALALIARGISATSYDDLQAVRLTRGFLQAPDRYLRQIAAGAEAGG